MKASALGAESGLFPAHGLHRGLHQLDGKAGTDREEHRELGHGGHWWLRHGGLWMRPAQLAPDTTGCAGNSCSGIAEHVKP